MKTIYVEFESDELLYFMSPKELYKEKLLFTREVSDWEIFSKIIRIRFFEETIICRNKLVFSYETYKKNHKLIRCIQYSSEIALLDYIWRNQKDIIYNFWINTRSVVDIYESGIVPFLEVLYHGRKFEEKSSKLDSFWVRLNERI